MRIEGSVPEVLSLVAVLLTTNSGWHNPAYNQWGLRDMTAKGEGPNTMVEFPMESALGYAVQNYPKDCAVFFSLARFYGWVFTQERETLPLANLGAVRDYLMKMTPANCYDQGYYFVVGYANTYLGQPVEGAKQLGEAVSLNPQFLEGQIELANAYVQSKQPAKAIETAKTAFGMTSSRGDKSRAARIMGEAYEMQNDNVNALFRYQQADTLHRTVFLVQKDILRFYVKNGDARSAAALNSFIGGQGRESLHAYIDAYEIYQQYGKMTELEQFCEKTMADWPDRQRLQASANFTLGLIRKEKDMSKAKEHFRKAKELGVTVEMYKVTRNHPRTEKIVADAFKLIG